MATRSARMAESLARKPMSRVILERKSIGRRPLKPVQEAAASPAAKLGTPVSHFSLTPGASAASYEMESGSAAHVEEEFNQQPEEMLLTDNATDIRTRMEAELIALRRAQSVFADTHPSVDVHGKLQDLQEMYIGDLVMKDCQVTQLKSQVEALMAERSTRSNVSTPTVTAAVPPAHTSMLAARVQSLQRSVAQERQRRTEVETRLEDVLRHHETVVDAKSQITKLTTNHRIEVHELKARLTQLQDSNKRLQERLFSDGERKRGVGSGDQSPAAIAVSVGGISPASSAVGATDKVPYVKYASLRAEKRQMEAKLTAQIEQLQADISQMASEKETEIDKMKEHHRRVVADMERRTRLAEQTKVDESKELKEMRRIHEELINEKGRIENLNFELKIRCDQLTQDIRSRDQEINDLIESEKFLSLELEDREKHVAQLELQRGSPNSIEMDKLREERLDLLEKIEEREDMLKSLQDESVANRTKFAELESRLDQKQREIATMISQADELDSLLRRADQDVTSSRVKIQALTSEIESLRSSSAKSQSATESLSEAEKERDSLRSELAKLDAIIKAMTINADQVKRGLELEVKKTEQERDLVHNEKEKLARKVDMLLKQQSVKDPALVDAEYKIGQLEQELENMRREMERDNSYDSISQKRQGDAQISTLSALQASLDADEDHSRMTENVSKAETLFHQAVDLCTAGDYAEAVNFLEQAAHALSQLSTGEVSANDPETLKILESDIFGQLGVAFQSLSQVAEAIDSYTTAVDVDPEAHACHANLAVLLHHQSRIKEAETHASIAVKLASEIEEYRQLLSQIKGASNVTLSSPKHSSLRHSTRW